jgi:integrase
MSLFKRPNSKFYWYKFYFRGALIQESSKCTNRRDALTVENAQRLQLALGNLGVDSAPETKKEIPTFDQAIGDFLEWSKIEFGESSRQRYRFACLPLKKFFAAIKVDKIDAPKIEKYISWRRPQISRQTGEPVTRDTINRELVVLKKILRRLQNAGILRSNPGQVVKQLPENDLTFHVITEREEKTYFLASSQPVSDVARLMLETGMRCGEVYRIRRDEVFIEQSYLQITKGKTKSSVRRIHLSDKAKQILNDRLKRFAGFFLFPQNDVDGKGATKTLNYFHLKTVRQLKFDFRLYDFRHTFATRALESGVDLLTLASMLGHANLKMVMRYAHPSEERKAEAIRQMEKHGSEKRQKQSKIENLRK